MHVPVSVQGCNFPKVIWKEKEEVLSRVERRIILVHCVITKCLVFCVLDFLSSYPLIALELHRLLVPRVARSICIIAIVL